MKKIVFGSANHWTSPYQVGSHAWARLFAGHGWETFYLSDPLTPWHAFSASARARAGERFHLWRAGGRKMVEPNLRAWTPMSLLAPRRGLFFNSRAVLDHWDLFAVPGVNSTIRRLGFGKPEILWLDSVRHAGWGGRLKPGFTVLRVADWSAGFDAVSRAALQRERELVARADLVVVTAETLEEKVRSLRDGRPMVTIRNGVDLDFWSAPCPEPAEYARIPSPRVAYAGAIEKWFDMELLLHLARALPHCAFVMIGQPRMDLPSSPPSNIHWLGTRGRAATRALVRHAQVGIIPFRRNELIDCVCPVKLYEYMACGLPVVATRWSELERMRSPARLAATTKEWTEFLDALTSVPGVTNAEKDYARANSWEARWDDWLAAPAVQGMFEARKWE